MRLASTQATGTAVPRRGLAWDGCSVAERGSQRAPMTWDAAPEKRTVRVWCPDAGHAALRPSDLLAEQRQDEDQRDDEAAAQRDQQDARHHNDMSPLHERHRHPDLIILTKQRPGPASPQPAHGAQSTVDDGSRKEGASV